MKKKLICLTLSLLMLLTGVLSGCSTAKTEEDKKDEVDNSAKTITMWVVTDDETTLEAQEKVNEAVSKITKSKFKTDVVIKFCTQDKYYELLEEAIEADQQGILFKEEHDKALRAYQRKHKGEKPKDELTKDFYIEYPKYAQFQNADEEEEATGEIEEETEVNTYGIVEIKYPKAKENQVDIFYLSGYDKYMEYMEKGWLTSLSSELNSASKKLTDYISDSLMKGVRVGSDVYAIPNNVAIGEYTYMMIDKALYTKYYNKPMNNVSNILDLSTFLGDTITENNANQKTADDEGYIVPLAASLEDCMRMLTWYWDLYYTDISVYDTYFDEETGRYYVLNKEVEITSDDGEGSSKKLTSVNVVIPDMVYKTNDDGKLVDAEGNVLNYSYAVDETRAWYIAENPETFEIEVVNAKGDVPYTGGSYLVDENGDPVTPENDKRVIVANTSHKDVGGVDLKEYTEFVEFEVDDAGKYSFKGYAMEFDKELTTQIDDNGIDKSTYYYGYEKDADFSILGSIQKDPSKLNRGDVNFGFDSLFYDAAYREMFAQLMDYQYNGYYGEVKEGQTAAVSFVKGDARLKTEAGIGVKGSDGEPATYGEYTDPQTGKEYYVMIAEYPEATATELYGNMFAVYSNSPYLDRCMEVITYLNTNKEFRNLLQYGIEGYHYELEKIVEKDALGIEQTYELVKLLPANPKSGYGVYRMDVEKTGNCFIVTPTAEMGGVDAWKYAKIQNNDSLVNPVLGFDFNTMIADSAYGLDLKLIDYVDKESKDTWAKIMDCQNAEELNELLNNEINGLKKLYTTDTVAPNGKKYIDKARKPDFDPDRPQGENGPEVQAPDRDGHSPYTIYCNWLNQYDYMPK